MNFEIFQFKSLMIIIILSLMQSCICTESDVIQSKIDSESFVWFEIYNSEEEQLFKQLEYYKDKDTTIIKIDTLKFLSDFEFNENSDCHEECSPICQSILASNYLASLIGVESQISITTKFDIFNIGFTIELNNSGEISDNLNMYKIEPDAFGEDWIDVEVWHYELATLLKIDSFEFQDQILDDCYEIIYEYPFNYGYEKIHYVYSKKYGTIKKEETTLSKNIELNHETITTNSVERII